MSACQRQNEPGSDTDRGNKPDGFPTPLSFGAALLTSLPSPSPSPSPSTYHRRPFCQGEQPAPRSETTSARQCGPNYMRWIPALVNRVCLATGQAGASNLDVLLQEGPP